MVSSMMSSRFGEGFRQPSDREDIVYRDRGQLGLSTTSSWTLALRRGLPGHSLRPSKILAMVSLMASAPAPWTGLFFAVVWAMAPELIHLGSFRRLPMGV